MVQDADKSLREVFLRDHGWVPLVGLDEETLDRHLGDLTELDKRHLLAAMRVVNEALQERDDAVSDAVAVAKEHGAAEELGELPPFLARRYAKRLTDACTALEEMGDPDAWEGLLPAE